MTLIQTEAQLIVIANESAAMYDQQAMDIKAIEADDLEGLELACNSIGLNDAYATWLVDGGVTFAPIQVQVPDVIDTHEGSALLEFSRVGVSPGSRTTVNHATIIALNIVTTDPSAGTWVDLDRNINYAVSDGPSP